MIKSVFCAVELQEFVAVVEIPGIVELVGGLEVEERVDP